MHGSGSNELEGLRQIAADSQGHVYIKMTQIMIVNRRARPKNFGWKRNYLCIGAFCKLMSTGSGSGKSSTETYLHIGKFSEFMKGGSLYDVALHNERFSVLCYVEHDPRHIVPPMPVLLDKDMKVRSVEWFL